MMCTLVDVVLRLDLGLTDAAHSCRVGGGVYFVEPLHGGPPPVYEFAKVDFLVVRARVEGNLDGLPVHCFQCLLGPSCLAEDVFS